MEKIVKKTTRVVKAKSETKLATAPEKSLTIDKPEEYSLTLVKEDDQKIIEVSKAASKVEKVEKVEPITPAVETAPVAAVTEESQAVPENVPVITVKPYTPTRNFQSQPQRFEMKKPSFVPRAPEPKPLSLKELDEKSIVDLRKIAITFNVGDSTNYNKSDLIIKILEKQTEKGGNIFAEGVLEIINDGSHGVLRSLKMVPGTNDVYVSGSQIKRFNLKPGDFISGQARAPKEGERYLSLLRIEAINTVSPEMALSRPNFQKLTPIFPNKQIRLETDSKLLSTRLIDLLSPIGKGQRGMIVAPPKAGKTWLLKDIANGIAINHPEIHLIVVLIGERPEEVTDLERFVKGEVVSANFDEPPETHTRVAELAIERAKRLVEMGKDVVILMDSLTRLARAYNITAPPSGRTLSGGFDPVAIYPPKKFFGAARNFEVGGSLTIIATALVETGSRMDEVIFEEFKGTGNMELKLDRKMAQRRIYPAIDVKASSTRNDDLLLTADVLNQSWRVRRMLDLFKEDDATGMLVERLKKTKTNAEFLATLHEDL
jgi:transcription termination factor Rho